MELIEPTLTLIKLCQAEDVESDIFCLINLYFYFFLLTLHDIIKDE